MDRFTTDNTENFSKKELLILNNVFRSVMSKLEHHKNEVAKAAEEHLEFLVSDAIVGLYSKIFSEKDLENRVMSRFIAKDEK